MPESIYNLEIFKWIEKDIVENIIINYENRKYKEWEMILI